MTPHEFRDLIAGVNQTYLLELLDIGPATLRRWKTGKARIPKAAVQYLRIVLDGDLAALGGDQWQGFRLGKDGLLNIPLFHRPFDALQLQAMFFTTQDAWADKRDLNAIQRDLAALRAEHNELKKRAAFYRRACDMQSRMGLMLARIVDY